MTVPPDVRAAFFSCHAEVIAHKLPFQPFDKSEIRADQKRSMEADAAFLAQHAGFNFTIEGHCDERGSIECNIALGDKRAMP
jgi:outer membrane protein OmpA-like peptidoglycan-associated protein